MKQLLKVLFACLSSYIDMPCAGPTYHKMTRPNHGLHEQSRTFQWALDYPTSHLKASGGVGLVVHNSWLITKLYIFRAISKLPWFSERKTEFCIDSSSVISCLWSCANWFPFWHPVFEAKTFAIRHWHTTFPGAEMNIGITLKASNLRVFHRHLLQVLRCTEILIQNHYCLWCFFLRFTKSAIHVQDNQPLVLQHAVKEDALLSSWFLQPPISTSCTGNRKLDHYQEPVWLRLSSRET